MGIGEREEGKGGGEGGGVAYSFTLIIGGTEEGREGGEGERGDRVMSEGVRERGDR